MEKDLTQNITRTATAKAVLDVLKERDRSPSNGIMELRRVRYELEDKGIEVVPNDFLRLFKEMEKAGIGKIIEEKGKPTRFKWIRNMKDIGGGSSPAPSSGASIKAPVKSAPRGSGTNTELVLMLGPNRGVTIQYPADMSRAEFEFTLNTLQSKIID